MAKSDPLDIAIIGCSCRLAAASANDESLRKLAECALNISVQTVVPEEPDYFDARFFGLSPEEAAAIGPEPCVLLEMAYAALENAGYRPGAQPVRVAVFTGEATDASRMRGSLDGRDTDGSIAPASGNDASVTSRWILSRLGLNGVAATVAAPILSFSRAVERASKSLLSGETGLAIAGAFATQGAQVQGHIRGGGVVVLKPLTMALADGDSIHAVIQGFNFDSEAASDRGCRLGPAVEVAALIEAACALRQSATEPAKLGASILLEAATQAASVPVDPVPQLLALSAKTVDDLDQATHRLREFLLRSDCVDLGDVVYTLQTGREMFSHRRTLVCSGRENAITMLAEMAPNRVLSGRVDDPRRPIVFMLPGVGDQYVGMGHELYERWEVFRQEIDRCAKILEPHLGIDIRSILYPANQSWKQATQSAGIDLKRMLGRSANEPPDPDTARLNTTMFTQAALFTIEYATAQLWLSLGITPDALVGHSMGEYVAGCLAGVLSLEDALWLIATRAKLVNELPQAPMLAVMLSEQELHPILPPELSISLINGPNHCVVAGPPEAVSAFEETLAAQDVIARRVQNGHAFHTKMMVPILERFQAAISKVRFNPPKIRYISNVTGEWVTASQATDPNYWLQHVSHTARFSDALHRLWQLPNPVLVECGPGRTLSVLAVQHPDRKATLHGAIWSIRQRYENEPDEQVLLSAIGKVWLAGGSIEWSRLRSQGVRHRIPLPPYPHVRGFSWTGPAAAERLVTESSAGVPEAGRPENGGDGPANSRERELIAIWRTALGRHDVGANDSFGALGGDSLCSIGALMEMKRAGVPDEVARGLYQGLSIREMVHQEKAVAGGVTPASSIGGIELASIETPVFIRALGIFLVVASHFGFTEWVGNPALMVVSGLSFARFQLQSVVREQSITPVFRFMLRLAIPALIDTAARQLFHGVFNLRSFLLMDNLLEPWPFGPHQSPYFIDLLLQNLFITSLPLTIAAVRGFAIKNAYLYGMIFLAVSWAASVIVPFFWDPHGVWIFVPHVYMWLLALGWCAAYSCTLRQKVITSSTFLCMDAVSLYLGHGQHWYITIAVLVLIWFDEIPARIPSGLVRLINGAAAASLFIYLTHYAFDALLQRLWTGLLHRSWSEFPPLLSILLAMMGGFVVWRIWNYGSRILLGRFGRLRPSDAPAGSW